MKIARVKVLEDFIIEEDTSLKGKEITGAYEVVGDESLVVFTYPFNNFPLLLTLCCDKDRKDFELIEVYDFEELLNDSLELKDMEESRKMENPYIFEKLEETLPQTDVVDDTLEDLLKTQDKLDKAKEAIKSLSELL